MATSFQIDVEEALLKEFGQSARNRQRVLKSLLARIDKRYPLLITVISFEMKACEKRIAVIEDVLEHRDPKVKTLTDQDLARLIIG